MASKAHCFFCFEVLAANYDSLEYPDLSNILELYDQFEARRVVEDSDNSLKKDGLEQRTGGTTASLRLPSISRLQGSESSSRSTSVGPSTDSASSSNTELTTAGQDVTSTMRTDRLAVTDSYPMFVTWNTLSRSGHKSLRGCIGTFEPLPLAQGLADYSLTSALQDARFSPISANTIPRLSCSLTLLADFEETSSPFEWDLGTHGIRISFASRSRRYSATYLPDVAVEQGWTKEETIESLMRKAGWQADSRSIKNIGEPWNLVSNFKVVRYTGLKASASYAEWKEWQRWAKQQKPELWSS